MHWCLEVDAVSRPPSFDAHYTSAAKYLLSCPAFLMMQPGSCAYLSQSHTRYMIYTFFC